METNELVLSKGMHGLLKTHLQTNNKLSAFNRKKLEKELQDAKIFVSTDIPADVVAVNRNVRVLDIETDEVLAFDLVPPAEAKIIENKVSVLSPVGVALVGYREGNNVEWDMPEGLKTFKIQKVSVLA
ncbi:MAG: GreA/GreB family elongation factor [Bacteroidota bacterium]